jgi:trimethylamine--corrinoid protein Co-methyltransferase
MAAGQSPNHGLNRLTQEQCERIHQASLEILERTGVRLYEPEAVELLRKAGADISDGNRARIPARLVEWALKTAPKEIVLYDQNGEPAMRVGGYRSFYGPGSDLLNIIDHRSGERRKPVLQDVVEGITLCDALEHIDFVMSMFLPTDVNGEIADRYQMEVMLNRTTKPIVYVTYETDGCYDAVEMAEVVAGGAAALRDKPFAACYINVTTAMRHNEEALQKLLFLAEKGLPALYIPVTMGGVTGPVTPAGGIALNNAGGLVGLTIAQLKREGTPVIFPTGGGGSVDMRTMTGAYARPDVKGAGETLVHYYDLPMFTVGGVTDTKLLDQQASIEAALTLLYEGLVGGHIVHDLGYMESGLCGSLVQLTLCDEIVAWVKRATGELKVNDETLALDLIDKVGPDGQFLDSEHTLQHYRWHWYPRLIERDIYDRWVAKGSKTMAERAAERVNKILEEHEPASLPDDVAADVKAVVQRVEASLG